jgi:hypothetical protein
MGDTTKGDGSARGRSNAAPWSLCAAGVLAIALGGRAPITEFREVVSIAKAPTAPSSRVLLLCAPEVVFGHVDSGSLDDRETFVFVAAQPCRVRFHLTPTLPGTDLELRMGGVETTESAVASAGEKLDLVVRSTWGSSFYRLEIQVDPIDAR